MNNHPVARSVSHEPTLRAKLAWHVVLADAADYWVKSAVIELSARGCTVTSCRDVGTAKMLIRARAPDLLVAELRLADGPSLGLIQWIKRSEIGTRVVIATSYGSVATAVKCTRLGVDGYLVKPANVDDILGAAQGDVGCFEEAGAELGSLERARWEYLNQCVEFAGSISRAATLLGLDRRSLRRMLSRYAPAELRTAR
jgi:two-component system response regulator RegA